MKKLEEIGRRKKKERKQRHTQQASEVQSLKDLTKAKEESIFFQKQKHKQRFTEVQQRWKQEMIESKQNTFLI